MRSNQYGGVYVWTLLPYSSGGITYLAENDIYGNVSVSGVYTNGTAGSPFAASYTLLFYSVVIKGSAGNRNSSIDYSNYEEVKAYYNLKD
jgi:hypothetical protein